ncbi:hypothetical protein N0A02_13660 [Paraburkholderia acidicola]|uniref:Uncharacterized protein n=1 Tax=Paraburkholderia acidicola TaxID=1912599 RepID=A0ABV1LML1_9BURK
MSSGNHLANFKDGASRLTLKTKFEAYGIAQRDGTSFVLSPTETNQLLASARGNSAALEEALGLPTDALSNNVLYRIDIPNPQELNLRMPSGNEAGANSQWISGGYLPDGNVEAVIDAGGIPNARFVINPVVP